ncbi:MAG: hypothetical protein FJ008_01235 [Chloroflexi bacterium]|nr:hypothetical protein [Chloroflexota bacterium]MBM3173851.1 hypothetical protein [Chloroflexota bacterium]MBM3176176.1 hypothetical protein [Chloroflexota bacterium]MBM4450682.1 hypothetical protein [Chloroflexota bacterium]
MTELDELLGGMGKQLGKAWVMGIADNDGMLIASWQSPENLLNPEFLAGHGVRLIRSLGSLFTDVGQDTTSGMGGIIAGLEDVVLTTGFSYIMVRPMCNNSCYLFMDVSKEVPLGLLRLTAASYIPKLEKCLPGA